MIPEEAASGRIPLGGGVAAIWCCLSRDCGYFKKGECLSYALVEM